MKTKEEIDELYHKLYSISIDGEDNLHYYSFVEGYTQCQEDMADVIKQAIEYGYQLRCNNKPINSGIDWVKEFKETYKHD